MTLPYYSLQITPEGGPGGNIEDGLVDPKDCVTDFRFIFEGWGGK